MVFTWIPLRSWAVSHEEKRNHSFPLASGNETASPSSGFRLHCCNVVICDCQGLITAVTWNCKTHKTEARNTAAACRTAGTAQHHLLRHQEMWHSSHPSPKAYWTSGWLPNWWVPASYTLKPVIGAGESFFSKLNGGFGKNAVKFMIWFRQTYFKKNPKLKTTKKPLQKC